MALYDESFPTTRVASNKQVVHKQWMTRKHIQKEKTTSCHVLNSESYLDESRYKLTSILKQCKKQHYCELMIKHRHNMYETCRIHKNIIHIKKSNSHFLKDKPIESYVECSHHGMADVFCIFFANIGRNLAAQIDPQNGSIFNTLRMPNSNSMLLIETIIDEVLQIVKNL